MLFVTQSVMANEELKQELVACSRDGLKNEATNIRLFSKPKSNPTWKTEMLSPQAVMGGVRSMLKPCLLYRAPMKQVSKFGKETYALEITGTNHLGDYYLSKHLFNISFPHDPYLRSEPNKLVNRSSLEAVYQLGN